MPHTERGALPYCPSDTGIAAYFQKDVQYNTYYYFKDYKELQTVCANADNILETEREARYEQQHPRKNEQSL